MSHSSGEGLRERKRQATREAIERSAIDLVSAHGYDNVTVEMICEAAMISPRTFFNYAGSKERAVLGIEPPLPSENLQQAYVAGLGGSPLRDLLTTMSAVFAESGRAGGDVFPKRQQIVLANPELAVKEFARLEEAQTVLVELIRRRLRADAPEADDAARDVEAHMTFALALGVMHHLAQDWLTDPPSDADAALEGAVELARKIVCAPYPRWDSNPH